MGTFKVSCIAGSVADKTTGLSLQIANANQTAALLLKLRTDSGPEFCASTASAVEPQLLAGGRAAHLGGIVG